MSSSKFSDELLNSCGHQGKSGREWHMSDFFKFHFQASPSAWRKFMKNSQDWVTYHVYPCLAVTSSELLDLVISFRLLRFARFADWTYVEVRCLTSAMAICLAFSTCSLHKNVPTVTHVVLLIQQVGTSSQFRCLREISAYSESILRHVKCDVWHHTSKRRHGWGLRMVLKLPIAILRAAASCSCRQESMFPL